MQYEILNLGHIRMLREENNYTQKQIAKYLHVRQGTYSKNERGELNYPLDVLVKLANLYGVSVDYLLGRTSVKEPYGK